MDSQFLDLSGLGLTELPELPDNLVRLNCSHNQLTSLPSLPETLKYLDCSYNELEQLPALPLTLAYLNCSHNFLNSITGLPDSLEYLNFFENDIPNEPTVEMLNLPNIKKINGGTFDYKEMEVRLPRETSLPVKGKLGICLDGDEPYRIETYLSKSKDNVVTAVDNFFNCCKRSKLGKGNDIVRYLGVDYYYIPCVERWVNKIDFIQILDTKFCIYNFIDTEVSIDGVSVSVIVSYTLKDYEETN